jgi:hypothetical protein
MPSVDMRQKGELAAGGYWNSGKLLKTIAFLTFPTQNQ